ncbi:endolytic transglycosylase MltG [Catellatospora sp. KI3]|uniref:endolytic transglycosylase MltG n=1 Tax=Catellatospora sp. KI3 TaxID=3041620 RepID=UPI0024830C8C|nr:endolytic transglycosylase MltG [Catellatospora sp. KI3]MDI1462312.1 endolytic transglycosylase MltG [Catellatospora sp. KI3]
MTDELFLPFDEHPDRDRRRRRHAVDESPRDPRRKKKKKKKRGRGRSWMALLLSVVLLGLLGGIGYFGYDKIKSYFVTPDYTSAATSAEVTVEIKPKWLGLDMAKALKSKDVIASEQAFIEAWEANPKAKGIQPGFYKLRVQLSAADAITMLLDTANRIVKGITIPEGKISLEIFDILSKGLDIPVADFVAAAKDPKALGVPDWWFNRKDGKKSALGTKGAIDGFLFPATYEFPPNVTAKSALQIMVQKFLDITTKMGFVDTVQAERGISPYEALVAASIAQAESVFEKDMAPVARVLYNRVYTGDFPCNCLQIDSAVNYWLRLSGKLPKDSNDIVQSEQHNKKDPYNTFDFSGMPLGPISNPGEVALKGAMNPPKNGYMFFMTIDQKGTMGWAKTWSEHLTNIRKACSNGILSGGSCNQ